jgi:hypothetical protein
VESEDRDGLGRGESGGAWRMEKGEKEGWMVRVGGEGGNE